MWVDAVRFAQYTAPHIIPFLQNPSAYLARLAPTAVQPGGPPGELLNLHKERIRLADLIASAGAAGDNTQKLGDTETKIRAEIARELSRPILFRRMIEPTDLTTDTGKALVEAIMNLQTVVVRAAPASIDALRALPEYVAYESAFTTFKAANTRYANLSSPFVVVPMLSLVGAPNTLLQGIWQIGRTTAGVAVPSGFIGRLGAAAGNLARWVVEPNAWVWAPTRIGPHVLGYIVPRLAGAGPFSISFLTHDIYRFLINQWPNASSFEVWAIGCCSPRRGPRVFQPVNACFA